VSKKRIVAIIAIGIAVLAAIFAIGVAAGNQVNRTDGARAPAVTLDSVTVLHDWIIDQGHWAAMLADGYSGALKPQFILCEWDDSASPDESPMDSSVTPSGCGPSDTAAFTSETALAAWLKAGGPGPMGLAPYAALDLEGWSYTPESEKKTPQDMINAYCAAVKVADAHHVKLIATPVGGDMYNVEAGAAKCGAWGIDLQFQANDVHPARYRTMVRTALKAIHAVRKSIVVIGGIGSDSGGYANPVPLVRDAVSGVKGLVNGFWYNEADWVDFDNGKPDTNLCDPNEPGNTIASGCVLTGILFFSTLMQNGVTA